MLRRMLGLSGPVPEGPTPASANAGHSRRWTSGTGAAAADAETATVREIVARLDAMPQERARFLAGFAYILSRAAQADLHISDLETREIERIVVAQGHIPEAQAIVVVQIAKTRADLFGPTEDYLVTREFRAVATDEERLDLLHCCFLVGAADGTITSDESSTLMAIAAELGIDATAVRAIRAQYAEQFAALQAMRRARHDGP